MTDATDAERCWQDGLSDALLTFRCQAVPVGPDPAGGVVSESVGEVGVVSISAGPQRWIRSPREVRDGGRGRAVGLTVVEGEVEVAQGATKRTLRPGATGLIDGALPSTVDIAGEVRIACLVLSRDLFAKRCLRRGATPGMPDAPRGVAAPVSAFIAELPEALTDPELSSLDRQRLGSRSLELLQLLFSTGNVESDVRADHLARANMFIDANLGDADLSPPSVAYGAAVSLRYLHQLYRDTGESVRQHIIRRRLDWAHDALVDPHRSQESVATIAASSGFKTAAHFTRCFVDRYEMPPTRHRAEAAGK